MAIRRHRDLVWNGGDTPRWEMTIWGEDEGDPINPEDWQRVRAMFPDHDADREMRLAWQDEINSGNELGLGNWPMTPEDEARLAGRRNRRG